MNERRRMFSVLASLVLMMTGTAYLLSMLEPTPEDKMTASPFIIAEKARLAIGNDLMIPEGRWREVELEAIKQNNQAGETLSAYRQSDEYHFLITSEGEVQSCPPWSRQIMTGQTPGTVRIAVMYSDGSSTLTDYQGMALDAILDELDQRCLSSGEMLSCRIQKGQTDNADTFAYSLLNYLQGEIE